MIIVIRLYIILNNKLSWNKILKKTNLNVSRWNIAREATEYIASNHKKHHANDPLHRTDPSLSFCKASWLTKRAVDHNRDLMSDNADFFFLINSRVVDLEHIKLSLLPFDDIIVLFSFNSIHFNYYNCRRRSKYQSQICTFSVWLNK